jgi:TatD DNase family protein
VIAIGETGLDFYRDHVDPARQEQVFRQHIAVSRELGKPLIVHIREAYSEVIAVLREEQAGQTGGIIHCYTGDWESARQLLDQGFYVGFSGISTFKSADTIREVIARMPEDKILIETDSPFLAPVPFRGKQNQPAYVVKVAEAIAKVRGLTVEAVADLTTANFKRLFPTVG